MDSSKEQQSKDVSQIAIDDAEPLTNDILTQGEKQFSIQPVQEPKGVDPKFAAHQAHPGPAIAQNLPAEEGSKEERQARKEALNK